MTRVIVIVCKSWKVYEFKELQWIHKNSMNPWKFRDQGLSVISILYQWYDKVPWKLRSVSEIHICMKSIKRKAGKKKQNQSLEKTFSSSINREFERK